MIYNYNSKLNELYFASSKLFKFQILFLSFAFLLCSPSEVLSQNVFPSPIFVEPVIQLDAGKMLSFTLSGLPDFKAIGGAKAGLEVQVNWQLGADCSKGTSFSEKIILKSTTQLVQTNYKLSASDNGKQLRINVSFVQPTGQEDNPAKGYIAATRECATLRVHK
jgi:hypothetical protein